jgi:hypothetical protein
MVKIADLHEMSAMTVRQQTGNSHNAQCLFMHSNLLLGSLNRGGRGFGRLPDL